MSAKVAVDVQGRSEDVLITGTFELETLANRNSAMRTLRVEEYDPWACVAPGVGKHLVEVGFADTEPAITGIKPLIFGINDEMR